MSITAGWDVLFVSGGRPWDEGVGGGCEVTGAVCFGLVGNRVSIVTWTDSVGRTAAGVMSSCEGVATFSESWELKEGIHKSSLSKMTVIIYLDTRCHQSWYAYWPHELHIIRSLWSSYNLLFPISSGGEYP